MVTTLYEGRGKRKTAVAKAFFKKGSGNITVNKLTLDNFFAALALDKDTIRQPLDILDLTNEYDIDIKVHGGGLPSQAAASTLAIARALSSVKHEYRVLLKKHNFLHSDSRIKERRKYGLKKARKASQYSKR